MGTCYRAQTCLIRNLRLKVCVNRRLNLNLQRVSRWRQNLSMGNVLLSIEIDQFSSCGFNYEEVRDSKQNRILYEEVEDSKQNRNR